MIDQLVDHIKLYWRMVVMCVETLVSMLSAKFLFFSFVALAIGTMGIWVPVAFELNLNKAEANSEVVFYAEVIDKNRSVAADESNEMLQVKLRPLENETKIENFSVFMYVIGILGILAAEHFIKRKQEGDDIVEAIKTFSMFIWFCALVLSFWALKDPKGMTWHLWVSLWFAISLWLSNSVHSSDFNREKTDQGRRELGGAPKGNKRSFSGEEIK
ncbi:hypothetical protein AB4356_20190 [Vibrio lentus]